MKPETSTNYKKIVDDVLDQINHGQLQKGDKLPTELCLATKFDVSRTCVREAIKSLEAMGIVQSIQGSGSYITNTPELSINRPICALFALSNGTLENVLDLRIVLETDVCRDIIRNATDEEIARVCALADYDYISTPLDQQSVLDSQFHNALMRMSHNALIKYIYTTLSSLMDIYRERVLEKTWRLDENALTHAGHQAICQALKDRDEQARQVEQEYQRQLKMNRNKADQPEDPRAKVRIIPASVSVAKLLQRMDYAQGQHLFSFCEEIDTLYKSNKAGSWSQKSDIYRNAFDNAEYGQDYMSENSYSTIVRVFYNLLLCGTPKAVTRFFPDCEDGLVSRVIFCHLPDQFAAQFPKFRAMLPATEKRLQTLVRAELGPEDGAKPLHTVNCDFLNDRMAAWLEAKRVEALKTLNKAEDQFRRRAAVIGFRAGMLAYYLSGEPKNKAGRAIAKEFAVWVANYVLAEQLGRFADQVNTTVEYKKRQVNCVHVFDSMPSEFSRSELVVLMNKHGYKQSARQTIWRWKREGLIVKSGGDMYSKVANKEENQNLDDSLNDSDNEDPQSLNSEVAGEAITKAR